MEKKWREENERIMGEYPALMEATPTETDQPGLPLDDHPTPQGDLPLVQRI